MEVLRARSDVVQKRRQRDPLKVDAITGARRRLDLLRSKCRTGQWSESQREQRLYRMCSDLDCDVTKSGRSVRSAVNSYEALMAPFLSDRVFDSLWPVTQPKLRIFVLEFVSVPPKPTGARRLARTAREYVSRLIGESRRRHRTGTIPDWEKTRLNRWIKRLGALVDMYGPRSAGPLTAAVLWRLATWCDKAVGTPAYSGRLQMVTMALVASHLGLRASNATSGLCFGDVDMTPNGRGALLTVTRGKGRQSAAPDRVPLYETRSQLNALVWLRRYTEEWFGRDLRWLTRHRPTRPVFPRSGRRGKWRAWGASALTKQLRTLAEAAGVPAHQARRLSMHSGRHALVTRLKQLGCPDHVIQSFTGHHSLPGMRPYEHVTMDEQLLWAERLLEEERSD